MAGVFKQVSLHFFHWDEVLYSFNFTKSFSSVLKQKLWNNNKTNRSKPKCKES